MAAIRLTIVGTTGVSRRITTIMIAWQTFGIDDDSGFSNLSGIHHDKIWQLRKEQNSSGSNVVDLTRMASNSASVPDVGNPPDTFKLCMSVRDVITLKLTLVYLYFPVIERVTQTDH
uniref:Uncharacterized protein n=1 Tax=Panagrellus redivivus TaxID=6233 RepID=A0A7E4VEJ2_PANRE